MGFRTWRGRRVPPRLVGLARHWPHWPPASWRVPVLLHLLLLLGHPRLPLLLLQGAVGTRATPPPELAEPSFPPQRPSGQHLNIGKIFGTSPGSTDLQEKFIQKSYFFTTKKCPFVYKIQYLHTTRWIYSKSLQMFSTYLFKTL